MPLPPPSNLTVKEQKTVLESTAIRYLSYRPRFKAEIFTRLGQKAKELNLKDPFTLINQIVESLEKSGFLNDQKMLESYIRLRLQEKVKGPYWIKPRLLHLGLSKSSIEAALKEYANRETQLEVIRKYLSKKSRNRALDLKEKAKLFRSLIARGFSAELISQAFDQNPTWE